MKMNIFFLQNFCGEHIIYEKKLEDIFLWKFEDIFFN